MSNRTLHFLGTFVRHPRQVGAVVPSSPALAKAMVAGLDVGPGQSVVELGPGTGAFTRAVLRVLPEGAEYLGVELDKKFVRHLRGRFPRKHYPAARFVEGSAEHVDRHHAEAELGHPRVVLCGLPFASLPNGVQSNVVAAVDRLLPAGGEFRTFQYVHAFNLPAAQRFRSRMDELLGPAHRSRSVKLNVPPAYVLTWTR